MSQYCPKCMNDPLAIYDGDWLYENGAFDVDVETQIICGSCDEKIYMKPFQSIDYEFSEESEQ